MSFLQPDAWWGLLGMAIPLIIHLLSKRDTNIVYFGSLQFLKPIESESARSVHFSQFLLLLLRMAVIALVCFFVAKPYLLSKQKIKKHYIEKSIVESGDYSSFLDSLSEESNWNLFTLEDSVSSVPYYPSTWTFLSKLNSEKDSAEVYSYGLLKNFKGQPSLPANHVAWNILPAKDVRSLPIHSDDNITWNVNIQSDKTTFTKDQLLSQTTAFTDTLKIQIVGNNRSSEEAVIKNFLALIEEYIPYPVSTSAKGDPDWSIIVGPHDQVPEGNLIHWVPSAAPLKIKKINSKHFELSGEINRDEILRTNLPVVLISVLNQSYISIEQYDERALRSFEAFANISNQDIAKQKTGNKKAPIHHGWWGLLIPFLIAERFYNYKMMTS